MSQIQTIEAYPSLDLPDTLDFVDVVLESELDFRAAACSGVCNLFVVRTDISKLNFHYNNFKLYWPNDQILTKEDKIVVYEELLRNFKTSLYTESYQNLDREYQEFLYTYNETTYGYIKNWIDKIWWDYDYDKLRILRISFWAFITFIIINSVLYPHLVTKVYSLKKFQKIHEQTKRRFGFWLARFIYEIPWVILYTGFVFFGWRLIVDDLNLKRPVSVFYILIQYVAGLICLAASANYIISR